MYSLFIIHIPLSNVEMILSSYTYHYQNILILSLPNITKQNPKSWIVQGNLKVWPHSNESSWWVLSNGGVHIVAEQSSRLSWAGKRGSERVNIYALILHSLGALVLIKNDGSLFPKIDYCVDAPYTSFGIDDRGQDTSGHLLLIIRGKRPFGEKSPKEALLHACVYIYIQQLSSFWVPTLWFIDLTVATCYIQYTCLSFMQICFTRKRTKHKSTRSPPFLYHMKMATDGF